MLGSLKAACATQSEAALTVDFSSSLRSTAKAVEANKITAIPRVDGRYLDI
jgi:hypothetical protein